MLSVRMCLSWLKRSSREWSLRTSGVPKPGLEILRSHGYNWIRLRLFHTPTELPNNLDYTIALAKSAKKLGFKFLLDYHYADDWADPGKQPIPKAWQGEITRRSGESRLRIHAGHDRSIP